MLESICPPALIYIIFSLIQIVIDTTKGFYNTAFIKLWVAIIFTILLNFLCSRGLGIISWFIVFIPFILMTLIITMLLFSLGLNPTTGKINFPSKNVPQKVETPIDYRQQAIDSGYYDNYNDDNVNTIVNQNNQLISKKNNSNTSNNNNIYNQIQNDTNSIISSSKKEATKVKDTIYNEGKNIENSISNIL